MPPPQICTVRFNDENLHVLAAGHEQGAPVSGPWTMPLACAANPAAISACGLTFTLVSLNSGGSSFRHELDGNLAPQPRVFRQVDLAHPTRAELGGDAIV